MFQIYIYMWCPHFPKFLDLSLIGDTYYASDTTPTPLNVKPLFMAVNGANLVS